MRRICFAEFGEPARVLRSIEQLTPVPRTGEVLLHMRMAPVHPADLAMIRGRYVRPPAFPAPAGIEGLGIVESPGRGVSRIKRGQRCVFSGVAGTWAEQIVVPAARLVPVPDAIPDVIGCQLFVNPLTAIGLLERVSRPGVVLQTAAGSAVGRLVIQLAALQGRKLVNLVRSTHTARDLKRRGVQHVVCTTSANWMRQVRKAAAGEPIVACFDPVAGSEALHLLALLSHGGELVLYGSLAGAPTPIGAMQLAGTDVSVAGFWLTAWLARKRPAAKARLHRLVADLVMRGDLSIPVSEIFPLRDVRKAVRAAESTGRLGKVLLRISG